MPSIQHLQRKRAEFQRQYDLLSEKIQRLRADFAIQADAAICFQLEKQIENTEAERDRIEQQIEALGCERLYSALLRLNYHEQVLLFRQCVEDGQRVGAFLIHGPPDHGQRWLLNRLLQHIPYSTTGKVIRVELSRRVRGNDISALWRELGGRAGLMGSNSPPEIAERVHKWWQTQSVVLVFHGVDCMPEVYLNEIVHGFWQPLASMARYAPHRTSGPWLLMFLIDNSGCVSDWNIVPNELYCVPIRLPTITKFTDDMLGSWIKNAINELPREFAIQVDNTVQTILTNSDNGVPELVLEHICNLCGCNWYERADTWLKF